MSFETISLRLAALQESNAQLKELIDRLANIKFQPGSIPLADDEDNAMTELTAEIQQTIKEQDEDFELLQEDIYDLDCGKPGSENEERRRGFEVAVERAVTQLKSHEATFRRAQLVARRSLVTSQKQERELLLQSYLEPSRSSSSSPLPDQQFRQQQRSQKSKALTQEERELHASSDFTLALRRTHESMAAELSRSQFAHETLKESTAALESLSEQYGMLDTMLLRSKSLLGTLVKSNKSDTWYLETAFYVLLATLGWLVWRRLLYGPTWWLLWFPMRMFIKGWVGVFAAVGLLGGTPDVALSSTSATSVSATAAPTIPVEHARATSRQKRPGGKPPVMNVGGGGRGAPMKGPNVPGVVTMESEDSVSDQVGKIIDQENTAGGLGESQLDKEMEDANFDDQQHAAKDQPNPKKRIWEEQEANRDKRELEREL